MSAVIRNFQQLSSNPSNTWNELGKHNGHLIINTINVVSFVKLSKRSLSLHRKQTNISFHCLVLFEQARPAILHQYSNDHCVGFDDDCTGENSSGTT